MIKIMDATLTMLDKYSLSGVMAAEFIRLLGNLSIHEVVISPKVYQLLQGKFPEGMNYYLELPNMAEREKYPGIKSFFSSFCDGMERGIQNIQINDISELKGLEGFDQEKKIRLTGLDDLLIYESQDIYERGLKLLKRVSPILYPEDSYYCACAIAADYLQYNHNGTVMTTFTGIGNKAATEQVLLAMRIVERYKPNCSLKKLADLRNLFEKITGIRIPDHAPVIGRKIFYVESGIHVAGVLKKPSNYESFSPELVGADRKVVLGKHSGGASIRHKLKQFHLEGKENVEHILELVKRKSVKKGREVTDEEFIKLINECEEYEKTNQTS